MKLCVRKLKRAVIYSIKYIMWSLGNILWNFYQSFMSYLFFAISKFVTLIVLLIIYFFSIVRISFCYLIGEKEIYGVFVNGVTERIRWFVF